MRINGTYIPRPARGRMFPRGVRIAIWAAILLPALAYGIPAYFHSMPIVEHALGLAR